MARPFVTTRSTEVFDLETLCDIMGELGRFPPAVVGVTVRPEARSLLEKLTKPTELSGYPCAGIPIYVDLNQRALWIPFYDVDLLRNYLNRNQPKGDRNATDKQPIVVPSP